MYPWPRAVMWKSPWTLLPSRLPKILHESVAPLILGVFANLLLCFLFRWSCTSRSSISQPWPMPSFSSCTPFSAFLPVHCAQLVGSLRSKSPASVRSPAASCMLTCKSAQRMAMMTSRLMRMSCETPFSTENVWLVVPVNQREVSVHASQIHVRIRVTVHAEELRPWTRYVFLVLAGDISAGTEPVERRLTESIEARHNVSLGCAKSILIEALVLELVHGGRAVAQSGRGRPNGNLEERFWPEGGTIGDD